MGEDDQYYNMHKIDTITWGLTLDYFQSQIEHVYFLDQSNQGKDVMCDS